MAEKGSKKASEEKKQPAKDAEKASEEVKEASKETEKKAEPTNPYGEGTKSCLVAQELMRGEVNRGKWLVS